MQWFGTRSTWRRPVGVLLVGILGTAGCATPRALRMTRVPLDQPVRVAAAPRAAAASPAVLGETHVERQPIQPVNHLAPSEPTADAYVDKAGSATLDEEATRAEHANVAVAAEEEPPATDVPPEPSPAPPPQGYVLSLNNVFHLADAQNPNVSLARERIAEAYARVERADTLWLPSVRAGLNYHHHDGRIQDVAGTVIETTRSAFYGGLGAGAVGAGSPALPGLSAQFHLTDAIFQPRIAEHQAAGRRFGAAAARNDILRDAAVAYLELLHAEQGLAIAREALEQTARLTELTRQFAESGQGLTSDYERLLAERAQRQDQLLAAQERLQTASARLAQLLHADPTVPIHSGEPLVLPLDILVLEGPAASYVATGLERRPELAEQQHLVCEAVERLRRERYAPLVPSILLGMSYGGQGGGLGNAIINTGDRWDADAMAYWEVRNLGFGERAAREEMASVTRQARHREVAILDRVAREVTESHAQVTQRQARIEATRAGITAAEASYRLNLQRIENAQGLPIEALQAITALATARRAYLDAVIDYNIAQFDLCRAIGWFVDA